ncbi:hypothetical protein Q8A67_015364 [Cirrhinus molitorella]|uniref:Uncharacterized protein n=1 Tax=Cirrhinus molitorella TaxID=172907 RepID=A0AA88TLK9_9TELE|nr:hypothetical protein Q8A67_015364 [Cirrhinus molitorella]
MVEEGLTTPGGQPTAAEQVVEEPKAETESRRSRVMGRIRRTEAKPKAPATDAELWIQEAVVEPEQQRTQEELEGWWRDRRRHSRRTREPSGASGLPGHSEEEEARGHGGAAGSVARGRVWDYEAGGGDEGFSSREANGDWQTSGAPNVQMRTANMFSKQRMAQNFKTLNFLGGISAAASR